MKEHVESQSKSNHKQNGKEDNFDEGNENCDKHENVHSSDRPVLEKQNEVQPSK